MESSQQPGAAPDEPQEQDQTQEPQSPAEPDEDAGPAVEPAEGDQGEYVEQSPASANAGDAGFDPNRPVRTSAPTPDQQSGVPQPTDGSNEGIEGDPDYRGPVDPSRPETGAQARGDETGAEPAPSGDDAD